MGLRLSLARLLSQAQAGVTTPSKMGLAELGQMAVFALPDSCSGSSVRKMNRDCQTPTSSTLHS
jgi:hypothetical protein